MREALLRRLPDRAAFDMWRILLAEEAMEALPDTKFENLLDLEECIAAVVDAVVVIVESAGSLCELGAFVKTDEINKKLIAILHNDHANSKSFVTIGAIGYLKTAHPDFSTLDYHWTVAQDGITIPDYVQTQLLQDLPEAIKKVPRSEKFYSNSLGHRIYATLSFTHILRAAKIGELKQCFDACGIEISETNIRKYLNTLEICKYIKKISVGPKRVYYVSQQNRMPLQVAFRSGIKDSERSTIRRLQGIANAISKEDSVRFEVFQEHGYAP